MQKYNHTKAECDWLEMVKKDRKCRFYMGKSTEKSVIWATKSR